MQYSVIIFLSILGAGALVLLGFATIRFYTGRSDDDGAAGLMQTGDPQQEQAVYMREVRARNQNDIVRLFAHRGGGGGGVGGYGKALQRPDSRSWA